MFRHDFEFKDGHQSHLGHLGGHSNQSEEASREINKDTINQKASKEGLIWTSEGEFLPGEVEPNPDSGSVADGEQASSDCACSMASTVHFNMASVLVLFFATLALYRRRYV